MPKTISTTENKSEKNSNRNVLISLLSVMAFIVVIIITIVIILSTRSCSTSNDDYTNPYKSQTKVNYEAEVLGTIQRKPPVDVKNEGWSTIGYPKYGTSMSEALGGTEEKIALRNQIIRESSYLTSKNTVNAGGGEYNRMDADGNLYLNDTPVLDQAGQQRYLYKHTASEGLYLGDVSDDEPGIIKKLTLFPRGYESYNITGLYAPAGEVICVEISAEDMESTSGILIHIGQALYNKKANNIWAEKNVMNRMPHLLNSMVITKETATFDEEKGIYRAYIGSFLGGPIYVHNENVAFTVTISGAVRYSHFILGYTTPEEFAENAKSTAPYFDLEVWDNGVLHSGPNQYAKPFSYDELYDAAILWEKISLVSTQIRKEGIVFLYDPFVAAGAAVAFPSQHSVNCPLGWMAGSLDYNSFVNNGVWGNMHEYNHNFQGFGVGEGGEVTNNSLNLVEYSLFTKISSNRKIGTINEGQGGWNCYTSASWALQEITEERYSNGKKGLAIYANILHNFGQEIFMESARTSNGQSEDKWFLATMNASHYDMTYFYKDLIGYNISDSVLATAKSKNYPMFVPVSSIYQTGRSYTYDGEKNYTQTMQPYVIPYGKEYTIDLNPYSFENNIYQSGSIVVPYGFSYRIKSVSQPENGTIQEKGNNIYTFTPNDVSRSGKIYVTLELAKDDKAFDVEDVELVLEFEQSNELNKTVLERTTYTFTAETMYPTATAAFEANYANYKDKVEGDNLNPVVNGKVVQNSNTDVWFTDASQMADYQIVEVKGKLLSDENAKYRIALRGRYDCALYVSLDQGKNYELAAKYVQTNTSSADFPVDSAGNPIEGTYKDYVLESNTWLYFKVVLVTKNTGKFSFVGVGWGKFTPETAKLDEAGNEVGVIPESVKVSYASAYRESYEISDTKFETEYFYKRQYTKDYKDNVYYTDQAKLVTYENYAPYNANRDQIKNFLDGKKETYLHTNNSCLDLENKPLVLVVDLGKQFTANQMTIFTQNRSDPHYPTNFKLEVSMDGNEFKEVGTYVDQQKIQDHISVQFEETSFQYYRLTITKSSNKYIIITEIEMAKLFEINGGHQVTLDSDEAKLTGKWNSSSTISSFGHLYLGEKGSKVEYEFDGNRFGILSSSLFSDQSRFEVTIDGKKVDSIQINDENQIAMTYISPELKEGKHKVTIQCLGNANIDSFVYWD